MNDVLDAIEEEEQAGRRTQCKVCRWLDAQDPPAQLQWVEALDDTTRQTEPIHRAMKRFGFEGSATGVRSHRSGHRER